MTLKHDLQFTCEHPAKVVDQIAVTEHVSRNTIGIETKYAFLHFHCGRCGMYFGKLVPKK